MTEKRFPRFLIGVALCLFGAVPNARAQTTLNEFRGGLHHELLGAEAYPVAPIHVAGGKLYEVVSGSNGSVLVLDAEGRRMRVADPRLTLAKGERFADGAIEVTWSSVTVAERWKREDAVPQTRYLKPRKESGIAASARFVSSRSYSEAMVGLLLYGGSGGHALHVMDLGDVARGEAAFRFFVSGADRGEGLRYAILFFSPEGEIASSGRGEAAPLVGAVFESFYRELVYQHVRRRPEASVSLVQSYPIVFDGDSSAGYFDGPLRFQLLVGRDGFVESVEAPEGLSKGLKEACERSLREWLFLPKVEGGFARASRVRVPVRLQ